MICRIISICLPSSKYPRGFNNLNSESRLRIMTFKRLIWLSLFLWIKDLLDRVSKDRRIAAFIYYNYYPKDRGYPNWRLDSDGITLQIFRKWANDQNIVSDLDK